MTIDSREKSVLATDPTGHGQGSGARVLEQKLNRWPALEVLFSRDDIRQPTEWRIKDTRHTMVVHLGGEMHALETEMDGHGGSQGPAIAGEDLAQLQGDSLSYATAYHLYRAYGSSAEAFDYAARPTSKTLDSRQAKVVRDYVSDKLATRVQLPEMAALLDLAPHRFRDSFKATFGVTPAQYVLRERIRAAQRFLRSTNYDITSVALACGFSSHSHMTNAFQKRLGCSPSAFRNGSAD